MSQMFCGFCRRRGRGERLPRGWKVSGDLVCCRRCRRQRYRLRSITMAIVEPVGATWQELRELLGESWTHALLHVAGWQARVAGGQPVVRVLIRERWWELRLQRTWSGGQRAAFEAIASGAASGDLFFRRGPSCSDPNAPAGIMCRMVAWLPRERMEDASTPQDWLPRPVLQDHSVRRQRRLDRAAIRVSPPLAATN